jgi:Holliday junction resolvasome RuvABC endonuclease subunit
MVAQVLGLPAIDGPPDVADALALAICHLTTVPLRRAMDAALAQANDAAEPAANDEGAGLVKEGTG